MARNFEAHGYQRVNFDEKADVYVINSCSVTGRADKKSEEALKKARKQNPHARVVMVGCYAQLQPDRIARLQGVDLILGSNEKFRILDYLENQSPSTQPEIHTCQPGQTHQYHPAYSYGDRTRSFLKVQDGCDYKCSYCTIPLARGKSRNQPVSEIVEEARLLGRSGIREVILTGVNTGDFGKSTGETFQELIAALEEVPGIERYRISSVEPNLLNNDIISFVAQSQKFLPHFHLPLQSGSDEILGKMRRRYRRDLFRERIGAIRQIVPEAFIGVDLIVGFPGEDEKRFRETMDFIRELEASYYHVFSFSARPNTPAASMKPRIPRETVRERSRMVQELAEKKKQDFYRKHLGQVREVLFEGTIKNGMNFGFTDNYIRVEAPREKDLPGSIKKVQLQELTGRHTVRAIPVSKTSNKKETQINK
jgi:threonylcarbamoyladenosine tRNA methylthiotransferase MtaB